MIVEPQTLQELLSRAAEQEQRGVTCVDATPSETVLTYAQLHHAARCALAGLLAAGFRQGDPVPIVVARGASFLPVFWGCQLGGLVPAPLAPPSSRGDSDEVRKLTTIWKQLDRPSVVCEPMLAPTIEQLLGRGAAVPVDRVNATAAVESLPSVRPEDLGLIQFSSGSTGDPKGVMLTHRSLVTNAGQVAARVPIDVDVVELGWMPMYHDMGLIACHLAPMLAGAHQVRIDTIAFLKKPGLWFEQATRHRAVVLSGTNTALRLMLKRVPSPDPSWDLSSVRAVVVGAEPISPIVFHAFLERFASVGLRKNSARIAYGLAEACVGVAVTEPDSPLEVHNLSRAHLSVGSVVRPVGVDHPDAIAIVGVGPALDKTALRVVDDDENLVPEGVVGHVQVAGPQLFAGYHRNEDATKSAMCGSWLRTGNLGFLRQERLVLCGRVKDLLFAGGRNVYAYDVELAAMQAPDVHAAVVCAVPAPDGTHEQTLLFIVVDEAAKRPEREVLEGARKQVSRAIRVPVDWLIPIEHSAIPRTSSGKIRRYRLGELFLTREFEQVAWRVQRPSASESVPSFAPTSRSDMEAVVRAAWAVVLGLAADDIGANVAFSELGGGSVEAQELLARLEDDLSRPLGQDLLLQCSTVREMADFLRAGALPSRRTPRPTTQARATCPDIAIVSMACRFPSASSPEAFWQNLAQGVDAVSAIPNSRWSRRVRDSLRCRWGAFLDDPYAFDAQFFHIDPEEARVMDPQQRLLLETAVECVERAGLGGPRRKDATLGVFVGASQLPHQEELAAPYYYREALEQFADTDVFRSLPDEVRGRLEASFASIVGEGVLHPNALVGNLMNMLAARIAHELDFRGPAVALDSACSSSLVAVHQACESLRRSECDLALAGGVSLNLTPSLYRYFEAAGALSESGRCRAFSAEGDGFVPGEGGGLVLLRPLNAALANGDRIHAVIRASAVNNDGRSIGVMAPNPEGQEAVLEAAYRDGAVEPSDIAMVECHGTGTAIGDPIELKALRGFFGTRGASGISIGSVKTNIGHLLGAAGVAGLFKAVLAVEHGLLPPSLHAEPIHDRLRRDSVLRLQAELGAWPEGKVRRAAVSSFGFGGTNCHVVLEQAPPRERVSTTDRPAFGATLLTISAPTDRHLRGYAATLALHPGIGGEGSDDVARTCRELREGRATHPVRAACVLTAGDDLVEALHALGSGEGRGWLRGPSSGVRRPMRLGFLFPGQGAQSVAQSLGLYERWSTFRRRFEELCQATSLGNELLEACYGAGAEDETLRRTDIAQPLIVAFQVAMGEALAELGLHPAAVVGHSVGELSAACLVGALDATLAVRWAEQRGRLMQAQPATGGMLAVLAGAPEVEQIIAPWASNANIAGYNAPDQVVVAGDRHVLADIQSAFEQRGITVLAVAVAHAFHAPQMKGAARALGTVLEGSASGPLLVPMISTVTGQALTAEALTVSYWQQQILRPVRFMDAFVTLSKLPIDGFLELGPGATLSTLGKRTLPKGDDRPILSICRKPSEPDGDADRAHAVRTLGALWSAGAPLLGLPAEVPPAEPRPVLPTVPFVESSLRYRDVPSTLREPSGESGLFEWVWEPMSPTAQSALEPGCSVLVVGAIAKLDRLVSSLGDTGVNVVLALPGDAFTRVAENEYRFDRRRVDQCRWLLESVGRLPRLSATVYLADDGQDAMNDGQRAIAAIDAFATWVKATIESGVATPTHVVTCAGQPVGTDTLRPGQAAVGAFALAAFEEVPGLAGHVLDVVPPIDAQWRAVVSLLGGEAEPLVALRGEQKLVRRLSSVVVSEGAWRKDGTYLLLGGAGGVGLSLARAIVERSEEGERPRIVLSGRRQEADVQTALEPLRAMGAIVTYRVTDVRNKQQLVELVRETARPEGRLDGVFLLAGAAVPGSISKRRSSSSNEVLAPKLEGAEQLRLALDGVDYGFVALMSSVAGSVPALGKGLADYAAANAFLDGFAARRRQEGEPWISVGTSLWRNTGLANLASSRLEGGTLQAARAAERVLACTHASMGQVLILTSDDQAAASSGVRLEGGGDPGPRRRGPRAVREIVEASERAPAGGLPPSSSLESFLRSEIGCAMGVEPEALDPDEPFQALGLSSLAAVDLMKEIEERVGKKLSTTLLFEHNTLSKLLDHLQVEVPPTPQNIAFDVASTVDGAMALLPAQQTFYANQEFYPDTPCYVFMQLDLKGELAPEKLDEAIRFLFERHAMLRVVFAWEGDRLVQKPGAFRAPGVETHDLRGLSDEEKRQRLDVIDDEVRNQVFDLSTGPLFRAVACRMAVASWQLLFNVHHIIADAWSAQILVTELLTLHADLVAGQAPSLPAIRSDFARCAREIERAGRGGDGSASAAYWRETLRDSPETVALPFDGDPMQPTSGGCRIQQDELSAESTEGLERAARRLGVSVFQLVLAAYAWCLRGWSGQDDLIIRVANARREARVADIQRVVGSFADSLPVRVRVPVDPVLRTLLDAVSEASLGAQAHPFTSSMQVAGMHGNRRHSGPKGVSPAGLSFPSFDAPTRYGDVRVVSMRGGSASGFTQLGLIAWKFAGRLHLSWNYTEPLFRRSTMQRLASECAEVLTCVASTGALPPLAPTRRTTRPLPAGDVVHDRILRQADTVPERVAVGGPCGSLTYGELAGRTRRLASILSELRQGPRVGILAHPGAHAIVGVLGILASGAAYVPVSPDYPDARIAEILAHAAVEVLVLTADQCGRLPAFAETSVGQVIVLDADLAVCSELPPAIRAVGVETLDVAPMLPLKHVTGSDLAYVMYTSGTTGRPKGVMVRHGAVSIFHDWVHAAFEVSSDDRFIQTSSLSFGGSIRQMFSPLLAGATVYPAPRNVLKDPFELVEFLEKERITIWNSVPTLWMRLLDCVLELDREGKRTSLSALRWILIGGEHVPAGHVRRWMDRFGSRHRIANLYGSTETVVNATWHELSGRPGDDVVHTPIGLARTGSEILLLDEEYNPCEPGQVGSLLVGGPSLSDGYLHAPAETEAAFIELPGRRGRYYRTGDLARSDEDGILTYMGRADTQVKVRGNRVELGEIEGILGLHPGVASAAVVEHAHAERQRLIAFVQPASNCELPDASALRKHVEQRLPSFMIPHRFELVDRLPLTAAGKLDRRALRMRLESPADAPQPVEAWTNTERVVASVWRSLLEAPSVGRGDDFFQLGGDSILALEMFQRLRGKVPVLPRPITLYGARTVSRLAAAIDRASMRVPGELSHSALDMHQSGGSDDAFPLSPSQEGFVLAERFGDGQSASWCARIPVRGRLDVPTLESAVAFAMNRHPMLRAVIVREGASTRQRWTTFDSVPLLSEDLRELGPNAELALEERFSEEQRARFALESGPLWRMRVCRTAEERWTWMLSVHHAMGDGWSVQVLGAEILSAYDALSRGESPAFPPLRSTFRDVVEHHVRRRAAAYDGDASYWTGVFEEPWPNPAFQEDADATTESTVIGEAETAMLRREARRAGVSFQMVVLTAWYRAIAQISGERDLVMGTATSGRDLPIEDIEGLVGCFATGLPIRAHLGEGGFLDDLQTVEAAYTEACAHADLPIEELLRAVPYRGDRSSPPGSQLFYSFMDFNALPPVRSAGLDVLWEEGEYHFAAQVTSTALMLGVMVGAKLRLNVHGRANQATKRLALDLVSSELLGFVRSAQGTKDTDVELMLDSAIVAYLPSIETLSPLLSGMSDELRQRWMDALLQGQRARLIETIRCSYGVSGVVLLGRSADEIPRMEPGQLASEVASAVMVAASHGARYVSLAGLLPSWTGYGNAVLERLKNGGPPTSVELSTGHGATVVAMVHAVQALLRDVGTTWSSLEVAVVGYGSIGQATVELLCEVAGSPRAIVVCDTSERIPLLQASLGRLRGQVGCEVRAVPAGEALPSDVYACDLILGASSEGGVVDVARLSPGAMVVDDSFPPIVDVGEAMRRMEQQGDVLVISGGRLDVGEGERSLLVPIPGWLAERIVEVFDAGGIPGCRVEAILLAGGLDVPVIHGLVERRAARRYWDETNRLDVRAPSPRLLGHSIPDRALQGVRSFWTAAGR